MSGKVLVLGNGESRANFHFHNIEYPIIGCNAAYRDIKLSKIICCDKKMVREVLSNTVDTEIYTRQDWKNHFKSPRIKYLPDLPFQGTHRKDQPIHWNSGPYAVLLSCFFDYQEIYLIGFDLYSKNGLVNNLYKNSENYKSSNSKAVDFSYWIYQLEKIFRYYKDKKFYVVNEKDWKLPDSWRLPNVVHQETIDL